VTLSKTTVELCDESEPPAVTVTVSASGADNDRLAYEFSVDSGRVITAGPNDPHATWDLSGSRPGVHKLSAVARAEKFENRSRPYTVELRVSECGGVDLSGGPCDYLSIDAPRFAPVNSSFNLTASFGDYNPGGAVYAWKVSPGKITVGQGEQTIRVDTAGLDNGQLVNAEVSVRVAGRTCERAKQVRVSIPRDGPPPIVGTVLDWEGNVVPGAKVRAFGDSGDATANTDERGEFHLSVPFGKYELEATALGCTQRIPYEHSLNQASALVIRLEGPTPTPSPTPSPQESPTPEPSPVSVTSQAPSPTPTSTPTTT